MIAVAAGILRRGDRLLICQRPAKAHMGLKWEFPGGKLEDGEAPERALERELLEELGVVTRTGKIFEVVRHQYPDRDVLLLFYESELLAGEPAPLEGQKIAWARPAELSAYDFAPADADLIDRLAREADAEKVVLVTGGARSGKSAYAEARARAYAGEVLYLATARVEDDEMRERVQRHRAARPREWRTHEGVYDLAEAARGFDGLVLLDCVTLLITAVMMDSGCDWEHPAPEDVQNVENVAFTILEDLIARCRAQRNPLLLVTNEVGMGMVPPYAMGRAYRDIAGRVNQRLCALCDEAQLLVCGRCVRLK